jgi:hypothetical protein
MSTRGLDDRHLGRWMILVGIEPTKRSCSVSLPSVLGSGLAWLFWRYLGEGRGGWEPAELMRFVCVCVCVVSWRAPPACMHMPLSLPCLRVTERPMPSPNLLSSNVAVMSASWASVSGACQLPFHGTRQLYRTRLRRNGRPVVFRVAAFLCQTGCFFRF